MSTVALWFRAEWRNRWRALVGLFLLIAFATAVVSTAFAGARRGASSVDRLLDNTEPATIGVLLNRGVFDWDVVRDMPHVEAVSAFVVGDFAVEGLDEGDLDGQDPTMFSSFPFVDDEVMRTLEVPYVLDGRLADPSRADEVMISTDFEHHFGKHVGDHLTIRLHSAEQIDTFDDDSPPAGPSVDVTIVGVIRSPWFSDSAGWRYGAVIPSPGLYREFPENVVGTTGVADVNALVRLDERSPEAINAFAAEFTQQTGIENLDTMDLVEMADHVRHVVRFEARALALLALAAAGASVLLIGLALSRFCAVSFQNLEVLRAFGLTPSQTRRAAVAAPASVALGAAVAGAALAIIASGRFPIGSAELIEPTPGIDVDVWVLVAVAMFAVALVVALSVWAVRPSRRLRRETPSAGGAIVGPLTAAWPLRVGMGTRLALEGGSNRGASSGRPALFAGVLGVTGVVAALIFSAGISDATNGFDRFGQTFELAAFFGFGGNEFADSNAVLAAATADPGVDGVNDAYNDFATGPGGTVALFSYDPVGEPIEVVTTAGRLPVTDSEVALAPKTADAAGVGVGDTITFDGTAGTRELTVTGLAFVPAGPHNGYADGGWVLPGAFDAIFDGFRFHFGLVSTAPGVDPGEVAERLAATGVTFSEGPVAPPNERYELMELRTVPLLLAAFLAILGVGAIAHTLTSTARRRRHDFAMLRALGMRPRDTTVVVFVQAVAIALVSLVIGVPAGILVGRALWRSIALDTPVEFVVPTAWLVILAISLAVLMIALALAAWPSRRLAHLRLGTVLRYE